MKKILIDASLLSVGGGVQVGLACINHIAYDPEIEVVCVASPQIDNQLTQATKAQFKYYIVEPNVPFYKKWLQGKRIAAIEQRFNPDLVFVVFGPAYWKPQATTLQGFALGKILYSKELAIPFTENIFNIIKKQLFIRSNAYLVVETEIVKKRLCEQFNYPAHKVAVIGNSYSPSFKKCVEQWQDNIALNNPKFSFLLPGSYYAHKNYENVIHALSYLPDLDIELIFTIDEHSSAWHKLIKLAQRIKVNHKIRTVGFIKNEDFAKTYLSANAIICASLVESSTAVFPEAFISKRPLLASNRDFATNLCQEGALYFDPLSSKDIAEKMKMIVSNNDLRDELIRNGLQALQKNYPSAEQKWQLQRQLLLSLN
ncbi:glycosyltransferase [Moraxella osloensis]|nr:glycosyltransferase [Moraxella osloensis]MDI4480156.1 glycosyltransferase [Moraxella osloensis]